MGENVKIGTTTNLKGRMSSLYVPMEDVLAIVPGGEDMEDAYHDRFRSSQVTDDGRQELFRLDASLKFFLGLYRDTRGTPRRPLPPGFLPEHEVGSVLDLDEELRGIENDGYGPWGLERVADICGRLAYLDTITGDGTGYPSADFAAMSAYYWHATSEECLDDLRERREQGPFPPKGPEGLAGRPTAPGRNTPTAARPSGTCW